MTAVASASLFLIGDADVINLSSAFDTPPESLIIGPFVPLVPARGGAS
nr:MULTISPECIES: spore gernimation protein GerPD [Geobacillus]